MTIQSQNRLIGAIILVTLAVIFLPDLLENDKPSAIESYITLPLDIGLQSDSDVVDQALAAQEAKERMIKKKQSQLKEVIPMEVQTDFHKQAWILQLGVFRQHQNAQALVKKLRDAGYTAHLAKLKTESNTVLSRVYVGPDTSKDNIALQREKISKLVGITGQVMEFNVVH